MNTPIKKHSRLNILLEFFGSMNLAITILVAIAFASVIGTVLQQNQPYNDYIIKFGPFWHEVFQALGLYNVYGALWFLALLVFLVLSTSVCIYRNTPVMLRDMQQFRLNVKEKSLRLMSNTRSWSTNKKSEEVESLLQQLFKLKGFRFRVKEHDDHCVVAGMKGAWNRSGYIFTHLGIVVLCIGSFLDGSFGLTIKEWSGRIIPETRDIRADKVPDTARLKPNDALSFRGSISLPEGSSSNIVFLNVRDGYLVQELPFAIELKDFRIEHYASGQPKSFESDLIIHDDQLDKPLEKTISVNHPLIYRGYAMYQASFGDGGSKLSLLSWPFHSKKIESLAIDVPVHGKRTLDTVAGKYTLEIDDFKMFNIFPNTEAEKAEAGKQFKNFGPSFTFKMRDASGVANEYHNYMLPVTQNERRFYLTGMRGSVAEPFRYLHIPADKEDSLSRFMAFHALLHDQAKVKRIAQKSVSEAMSVVNKSDKKMQTDVITSMMNLLTLFNQGGYIAIDQDIKKKVPKDRQVKVAEAYVKILQNLLQNTFLEVLKQEGIDIKKGVNNEDSLFFEDAISAFAGIGAYGSPVYFQLAEFKQRESSGIQITRHPGQNIFYLGCLMLIVGIFMMFYISYQRVWIILKPEGDKLMITFAGSGNRNQRDFAEAFEVFADQAKKLIS
ncbi:MAG: cytochrome c biogenesis protein ResB [Gammaproteobacteria bacterium]|nr:cytochrome c biogenesis protein ResB [Gammaproteobacteria bacterium]